MTMPLRPSRLAAIALPTLVALIGLSGSLATGLLAPPDASRVALLALPGFAQPWAVIDRLGLPVVRVLLGGRLIVVDGGKSPVQMGLLRGEHLILLNAGLVPGCSAVDQPLSERPKDAPDA